MKKIQLSKLHLKSAKLLTDSQMKVITGGGGDRNSCDEGETLCICVATGVSFCVSSIEECWYSC